MSVSKGNQENVISGKQKDSVQKEMLAASATTTVSVERKHNRPLLLQNRRLKNDWKGSLKRQSLRDRTPSRRRNQKNVQT